MDIKIFLFALLIGGVLTFGYDENPDASYEIKVNHADDVQERDFGSECSSESDDLSLGCLILKRTTKPPTTTTTTTTTEEPTTTRRTKPPKTTTKPPRTTTKPPKTTTKRPKTTTRPPKTTTTVSPVPTCSNNRHEKYPHNKYCDLYYECSNGIRYLRECPSGLHYDSVLQACNYPSEANCQLSNNCD